MDLCKDEFVASVLDRYQTMNDAQKNELLDSLLRKSSFVQLYFVQSKLKSLSYCDFISLLPQEMSEHILSFCDDAALFASCQVSKRWNHVISSDNVWRNRCRKLGLTTTKSEEALLREMKENCKLTYHRMARMTRSLKNGSALVSEIFDYSPTIRNFETVIRFWKSNVVIATRGTTGTLMIWDFMADSMISKQDIPVDDFVVGLKCQENLIVVSLMSGTLMSFALPSLWPLQTYIQRTGPCFALDFDVSLDMVVSGSIHGTVKLWSLSKGSEIVTLTRHRKNVVQVILRPSPDPERTSDAVLVTASCNTISVWSVPLQLSNGEDNTQRSVVCTADIPYNTTFRADICLFRRHLYYTKNGKNDEVSDGSTIALSADILCHHDVLLNKKGFQRHFPFLIIRILGIGTKYMCVHSRVLEGLQFQIVDVNSGASISKVDVTTMGIYHMGTPPVAFGCPDWLDGFNGLNNNGAVLYVANHKSVEVLKWKPEFICQYGGDDDV